MSKLAITGGTPLLRDCPIRDWPIPTRSMQRDLLMALKSHQLGYSDNSVCRHFEEDFASYHGVQHAIATNSGTSALWLAYFACGIGSRGGGSNDDEVIVPSYGFFATVSPLIHLGAVPIFCDVEKDTGNIDPVKVVSLITKQTKAIVVTHIAGHPGNMDAIIRIARDFSLRVIEDCSHAHGASLNGKLVGTLGDIAAFSFQTKKMVTGGEGGIVITNNTDLFTRAAIFGNFRRLDGTIVRIPVAFEETGLGLKLRMGPLESVLAHYHLKEIDRLIAERTERLDYLTGRLMSIPDVQPPVTNSGSTRGAYYEYPIRLKVAQEKYIPISVFKAALLAEGLKLPNSNTKAVYKLPLFKFSLETALQYLEKNQPLEVVPIMDNLYMPIADWIENCTLTLPTFTVEPRRLIDKYVDAIAKIGANIDDLHQWAKMKDMI